MSDPMQTQPFGLPPSQPASMPGPERSPNRGLLYALIGGGVALLVLLIAGGVLAWNLLARRGDAIPQFLPAETQFYATLTPNLSDVPNLQRLRQAFPELIEEQSDTPTVDPIEELLGVDFAGDIAPWIGTEIAVAVGGFDLAQLDPNADPDQLAELAGEGELMVVLASRDDRQAQAFLDKQRAAREARGEVFSETRVGDLTIVEQQEAENSPLAAFALYRGHVFFANRAASISAVAQRDPNGNQTLQANPRFQQVLQGLPESRIGFLYLDGRILGALAELGLEQGSAQLPPEQADQLAAQLENLAALQGLGLSFSATAEGLQFDSLIAFELSRLTAEFSAQLEEARRPVDGKRLEAISRDTVALLTFKIPGSLKDQILQSIESLPDGEEQLELFEDQFGINLERDLLDWFSGDATLALLPGDRIGDITLPATGYLALRPAERAAAEAGMEKIAAALEQFAGPDLVFSSESVGGADWQAIIEPNTNDLAGGYAFIGDDLVLAFGTRAMEEAAGGAETPISGEDRFKQATAGLASPNGGLIYLDMQKLLQLIEAGELGEELDADLRERLAVIQAISAAGTPGIDNQGLARARLIVVIAAP